ncbi:purple acid phosphatase family protein [Aeromicrobium endophyticum]|uniref:purple acid phosphatase family protein n=1 Tax=Aeromicrobium endophyticum TaxID=2292704 RepID=UPI0018F3C990|nr:metallophosphoesterase family protein [Aeromicrobium endophyticum]
MPLNQPLAIGRRRLRTASLLVAPALACGVLAAPTIAQAADEAPKPTRVILTPTETPETSQNITWQGATETASTAKVQIRPSAGGSARVVKGYEQQKAVNNAFPHFSATVTGLKPATDYSYRVASGSDWSDWHDFETADPDEKEFDYIYYGDAQIGLDTTWPSVVKQAQKTAPDAIGSVHAGDLIDKADNNTQWQNWFKGMETAGATTNVMAAPGNHEYSGDNKLLSWKAHFEYPLNQPADDTIGDLAELAVGDTPVAKQYRALFDHWSEFAAETVYFTDYQGVRFITINATANAGFLVPDDLPACAGADCPMASEEKGEALWLDYQARWLDHILSETPSKWNVVTFHQPVYSAAEGRDEEAIRKAWVPVFQKHDIDLVQMGHDHVYSRGFNNANKTSTPGITDGPVYVVSNSGAKHYDLETDEKNVWTHNGATQVKKGEDFSTYQVVSVSKNALHYKSYIAEKTPSATTDLAVGDVYDEFTVNKSDAGRKFVTEAGMTVPPLEDPAPVVSSPPSAGKHSTSVSVGATSFRKGRAGTVRVTASQDGVVGLVVRQGDVVRTRYVTVRAGVAKTVRTGTISKRQTRKVVVNATFTPSDGQTHAGATATRKVTARR